jgi:hypothetical protein
VIPNTYVVRADRNGFGTAGLVLGIAALCLAVIPLVGIVAWGVWPAGLACSGVGLYRADHGVATNRNVTVAGLVLSATAALVCVAWAALTVTAAVTSGAH